VVLQAVVALTLVLVLGPALAIVLASLKYEEFWPDPAAVALLCLSMAVFFYRYLFFI
jgi:hypothetical protein